MPIVTLTTDFGDRSYYTACLKGSVLSKSPHLQFVDICNAIAPHNIVEAAFMLKNAYSSFPDGTIHILCVQGFYAKKSTFLVMRHEGHYFILPDNGICSLLFAQLPEQIYELRSIENSTAALNTLYAETIRHIAIQDPIEALGLLRPKIEERITLRPVLSPSQIRGSIIHIDPYENAITNIRRNLFEQVGHGREFALYFKRYDPIEKLSADYQSVPIGETLCLFNAAGYLEIAINMGKAASLFGLHVDDTVQIDFVY